MNSKIKTAIKDIVHCKYIAEHFSHNHNQCSAIIDSQGVSSMDEFQLPEPFSGNIDTAKILVISSNPSIDKNPILDEREKYRTYKWDEPEVLDFFYNRFPRYINDKGSYLKNNGEYSSLPIRFECSIKARVSEILERDPKPGKDYCLTEIVHCKSQKEKGVNKAKDECTKLYLNKVFSLSNAKLIMVVGSHTRKLFTKFFNIEKDTTGKKIFGPLAIGNIDRMLLFIVHPAAHGGLKRLGEYLDKSEMDKIRKVME